MKRFLWGALLCFPCFSSLAFFDITVDDPHGYIFQHLNDVGIMHSFEDGNFHPEKLLTRAEALVIALRAGGIAIPTTFEGAIPFVDVDPNAWYAPVVGRAVETKAILAQSNRFRPEATTTKAEFLAFLFRATQVDFRNYFSRTKDLAHDIPEDAWYAPHFAYADQFQITQLPSDGMYRPHKLVSRREVAIMTFRQLRLFHGDNVTKIFVELQARIQQFMTFLRAGEKDKAMLHLQSIIDLTDRMTRSQNDKNAVAANAISFALTHFSDSLQALKFQKHLAAIENLFLAEKQAQRAMQASSSIAPFAQNLSSLIHEILLGFRGSDTPLFSE